MSSSDGHGWPIAGMGEATHLTLSGYGNPDKEETEAQRWITFGMRIGVSCAMHPFEYARVLIQLGYEPLAPRPGRTMFGREVLVLPNIFKYVGYIRRVDGLSGCFVGLGPKLFGMAFSNFCSERLACRLGYPGIVDDRKEDLISEREAYYIFKRTLIRDCVLHTTALTLAQPFQVVCVRMMAQFVGQETIYRSFWQSIGQICAEDGVFGLFAGLPARVLADVSCVVLASSTVYLLKKYLLPHYTSMDSVHAVASFLWSSVLYSLHVTSTCMTVTGTKLAIANAPHAPTYSSFSHCYHELTAIGESKRGSSLFFRYKQPVRIVANRLPMPSM